MGSLLAQILLLSILYVDFANNIKATGLNLQDIRREINLQGNLWKAGLSNKWRSIEEFRKLLGSRHEGTTLRNIRRKTIRHSLPTNGLPKKFDARLKWRNCTSIGQIRDQSSCGSCWAFGAVESMSDRVCIHSKGKHNVTLSALDLLACCENCGDGCEGGWPGLAWDFWKNEGIVTGGSYSEPTGCAPYPFPECTHHGKGTRPKCNEDLYKTPPCTYQCQPSYNGSYFEDKVKSWASYNVPQSAEEIMKEIYMNGPVEASFDVYEDFMSYESGIYHHVKGTLVGAHAVRILGWGVENGTAYWLLANSWNADWGEQGFFRMRRGKNECNIEAEVVAGLP